MNNYEFQWALFVIRDQQFLLLSFSKILSRFHSWNFLSFSVMQDKATLVLLGDNALAGRNESKLTEYIRKMDLLVLGHILLSLGMLSSIAIYYSVQAGPVLVLHIVSIMVTDTLAHIQRGTLEQSHIRITSHTIAHHRTPLHKSTVFRGKAKAEK